MGIGGGCNKPIFLAVHVGSGVPSAQSPSSFDLNPPISNTPVPPPCSQSALGRAAPRLNKNVGCAWHEKGSKHKSPKRNLRLHYTGPANQATSKGNPLSQSLGRRMEFVDSLIRWFINSFLPQSSVRSSPSDEHHYAPSCRACILNLSLGQSDTVCWAHPQPQHIARQSVSTTQPSHP